MAALGRVRSPYPGHARSPLVQAQVLRRPLARSRDHRSLSPLRHPAHALLPYFATYAAEAHRTGVPILRHLVLEYPDDPRSATAEYQYLLGDEPAGSPGHRAGRVTRKLYLPHGDWVNYWTGEHLTGGADVTVPAPLDQIPIFVRAGSILPFKPEKETARLNWSDPNLLPARWSGKPTQASQRTPPPSPCPTEPPQPCKPPQPT